MCRLCPSTSGLTRREFHKGLLTAGIAPACLPAPANDLLEPAIRLVLPDGAPRTVALTLDACDGATDQRILHTLLDLSVPATIFATGLWLRGNPEPAATMRAHPELFSVQNHGERHLPPVLGTRTVYGLPIAGTLDAVHREVDRGAALIEAAGFPRPTWYRGAAALYSPAALDAIQAMGFRIAGFSLSGDAGASLPAASVTRRMEGAATGDVIIAHINQPRRPSGAGVAAGVQALQAAGVRFVTLANAETMPSGCRRIGPKGMAMAPRQESDPVLAGI